MLRSSDIVNNVIMNITHIKAYLLQADTNEKHLRLQALNSVQELVDDIAVMVEQLRQDLISRETKIEKLQNHLRDIENEIDFTEYEVSERPKSQKLTRDALQKKLQSLFPTS